MNYEAQNNWYPYEQAKKPAKRDTCSPTTKAIVITLVVTVLIALIGGLLYYFLVVKANSGSDGLEDFLPYGRGTTDQEASSYDTISYTVGGGKTYTLFGDTGGLTPVAVQPKVSRGTMFVGVLENSQLSTTNAGKIIIHGAAGIRPMDTTLGEHFYHREATIKDKAFIDCLIPDFTTSYAYIATWIKVVSYHIESKVYTKIGSFQGIIAFGTDTKVYAIRNYGPDIEDAIGAESQFKIVDIKSDTRYDIDLVSADLRDKREVILLSEKVTGTSLPRIDESKLGDCSTKY